MDVKEKLYSYCLDFIQERIRHIKEEIVRVQSSANEETKSSAGDKYETGRAMAQLEVEMNTRQLVEAEKILNALNTLPKSSEDVITAGSLVITSIGNYYLAISVGPINMEGSQYFVISPESPIGRLMLGKRIGDQLSWNGKTFTVEGFS